MLDLFNIAKPQGCDIQTFYKNSTWVKPRGASNVYMMLIGGGGNNSSGIGGGSGAVTTWYGAAQNVPDNLVVTVSTGNAVDTLLSYRGTSTSTLLTASAAILNAAGIAMTANQFSASGFFQSVAGQAGTGNNTQSASATTFLSGGNGNSAGTVTANYGYSVSGQAAGFFMLQPIIVGIAAAGNTTSSKVGIGCGTCGGGGANGGPGLVLIASW